MRTSAHRREPPPGKQTSTHIPPNHILAGWSFTVSLPFGYWESPRTCEVIGTDPVAGLEWLTGALTATAADGSTKSFSARCRIDTPEELQYYKHGGILPYVLRSLVGR